jgi:hypothetical protein
MGSAAWHRQSHANKSRLQKGHGVFKRHLTAETRPAPLRPGPVSLGGNPTYPYPNSLSETGTPVGDQNESELTTSPWSFVAMAIQT